MADYLPLYLPGQQITCTASAPVTGGQLLAVSGNGTVAPATAATAHACVGVAAFDAAANALVTVYGRGTVHIGTASASITAGEQVTCGANGAVAPLAAASGATATDINHARAVVGIAMTTASSGDAVQYMER